MSNEIVKSQNAIQELSARLKIDEQQMKQTIMKTICPNLQTNEQFISLVLMANEYGLNPITRELWAFPAKGGGIIPIVSTDGWTKMMINHPNYLRHEFVYSDTKIKLNSKEICEWCEIIIYKKDGTHTITREWTQEVYRDTIPWKTHTMRMLKHKTKIQGARETFGYCGVYDKDEAERIQEAQGLNQEPINEKPIIQMPKTIEEAQEQPQEIKKETIEDAEIVENAQEEIAQESNFKKITQDHIKLLMVACKEKGVTDAKLKIYLKKEFGILSKKDILIDWFDIILNWVRHAN